MAISKEIKKTRLYNTWRGMIGRCDNSNMPNFKWYGKKGIKVCEEWNDYHNFEDWSYSNGYREYLTIDRKDSSLNYEPDNCRWITQAEQVRNRDSAPRTHKKIRGADLYKGKYNSIITVDKVKHYLGRFDTEREAGIAYNEFIISNGLTRSQNIID